MNNLFATQGQSPVGLILYVAVIAIAFYLLIFRPQKKQQNKFQTMLDELKVNDEVVTKSGVVGHIVDLDDAYFTLITAENTKIKYVHQALAYIVKPVEGYTEPISNEQEITTEELYLEKEENNKL